MHPERYKSNIIFVKKKSMSPAAIGKRMVPPNLVKPVEEPVKQEVNEMGKMGY